MAEPPKTTRLSSDLTKPQPTDPGDAPADTWDPHERAHSASPAMAAAIAAGKQSVNAVVPGARVPDPDAPTITFPVDGATVPPVHDVLGTALPRQDVDLYSANNDAVLRHHATVQADTKGVFAFTGGQSDGVDGDRAHFQVRTATGSSDTVTVTVQEEEPPTLNSVLPNTIRESTETPLDVFGSGLSHVGDTQVLVLGGTGQAVNADVTMASDTEVHARITPPAGSAGITAWLSVLDVETSEELSNQIAMTIAPAAAEDA